MTIHFDVHAMTALPIGESPVAKGAWWTIVVPWAWSSPPRVGDTVVVRGIEVRVERVTWRHEDGMVVVTGDGWRHR